MELQAHNSNAVALLRQRRGQKRDVESSRVEKPQQRRRVQVIYVPPPRVYMTDATNFRSLVQSLTGRTTVSSFSSSPSTSVSASAVPDTQIFSNNQQIWAAAPKEFESSCCCCSSSATTFSPALVEEAVECDNLKEILNSFPEALLLQDWAAAAFMTSSCCDASSLLNFSPFTR